MELLIRTSKLQDKLTQQGCIFRGQELLSNHEEDIEKECHCGRPNRIVAKSICKQCEKNHERVRSLQTENENLQTGVEVRKLTEQTAKEEWLICKNELEAIQEASIITMESLRVSNAVIKQYQDVLSNTQHMLFLERVK